MKVPVMPSGLKTQLKLAYRMKDIEAIISLNNIWNIHVKEEFRKQKESEVNEENQ